MKANAPDEPLTFSKVIKFPGNHSKFMIKRDPVMGKYLSIVSFLCDEHPKGRNRLALRMTVFSSSPVQHSAKRTTSTM